MTAIKDLQAIDSIFGSFKGATQATNEMALAYVALTEKQQAFVLSSVLESKGTRDALLARVSYTSAINACASAEATALLTKNGLTAAEAELLSEKVRETLQTKLQADAVEELTQAELKQIIIETAAANNLGAFSDAQADLLAQLLQTGKAADKTGESMLNFSNVAKTAGKNLLNFIGSIPGIIAIYSAAVYAAIQIYDKFVLTAEEAKVKSDELSEDVTVER